MQINNEVIEFCPDIQSECIGHKCAAFARGLKMIANVTPLLFKLKHVFDEDIPLILYLNIFHCAKYNKFTDHESLNIFTSINSDFDYGENYEKSSPDS
jgi:hypothetical protein